MSEFDRSPLDSAVTRDVPAVRAHLIEAASLIVRSGGASALRVRPLAWSARVDVWTVLRTFRTRDELLSALRDGDRSKGV